MSFHDLQSVSSMCKLEVPVCANLDPSDPQPHTGLRCWPGAATVFATDGSFVSCSACVHPSLYSAPASEGGGGAAAMSVVYALVAFVGLFVLVLLLLLYVLRTVVRSGQPSPVPLPAGLQRMWASQGTKGDEALLSTLSTNSLAPA